jgi:peptide/nickel transport system ATP-binding protein
MKELQQKLGLTYLFISHNLAVVRHMATTIGVMHLGRLVEQAPAEELFTAPRHPYTRLLLESVPDLGMSGRPRRAMQGEIPSPIHPPPGCAFNPRCPFVNDRCLAEDPPDIDGVACHAVQEGRISAKTPLPA